MRLKLVLVLTAAVLGGALLAAGVLYRQRPLQGHLAHGGYHAAVAEVSKGTSDRTIAPEVTPRVIAENIPELESFLLKIGAEETARLLHDAQYAQFWGVIALSLPSMPASAEWKNVLVNFVKDTKFTMNDDEDSYVTLVRRKEGGFAAFALMADERELEMLRECQSFEGVERHFGKDYFGVSREDRPNLYRQLVVHLVQTPINIGLLLRGEKSDDADALERYRTISDTVCKDYAGDLQRLFVQQDDAAFHLFVDCTAARDVERARRAMMIKGRDYYNEKLRLNAIREVIDAIELEPPCEAREHAIGGIS